MSMEFIVLTGTIISASIALAGLILNGQRTQREEIGGLREEIGGLRKEIGGLREEIGGLRERIAYLEGLIEGLREAITGRRVAEAPGEYGAN